MLTRLLWFVPVAECLSTSDGSDYRGKIQKTKTGKTCQNWSSQKVYSNAVHLPINHYTLRINRYANRVLNNKYKDKCLNT